MTTFVTTETLRHDLIRDLADLRAGRISQQQANARGRLSAAIFESVKIEIAVAAMGPQRVEPVIVDGTQSMRLAAE